MSHILPRVLFIDSNADEGRVVARAVSRDRGEIDVEADVEIALRKIGAGTPYDLILYDLQEQRPSGRQLYDAVSRAYSHDVPLVVLIMEDTEEATAYSAAGICVLSKPITETSVVSLLGLMAEEAAERRAGS